jgi:hypothetical protein
MFEIDSDCIVPSDPSPKKESPGEGGNRAYEGISAGVAVMSGFEIRHH